MEEKNILIRVLFRPLKVRRVKYNNIILYALLAREDYYNIILYCSDIGADFWEYSVARFGMIRLRVGILRVHNYKNK